MFERIKNFLGDFIKSLFLFCFLLVVVPIVLYFYEKYIPSNDFTNHPFVILLLLVASLILYFYIAYRYFGGDIKVNAAVIAALIVFVGILGASIPMALNQCRGCG